MMSEDRLALGALEDQGLDLADRGLVSGDRDLALADQGSGLADQGSGLASDVRLDLALAGRLDFIRLDLVFHSLEDYLEDLR